jgi:type I restriction enzyme S subunit
MLPKDTVLLTSRATIGAVALAGVPLCTNQGFASLVAKPNSIPRFLMYWCQHNTQVFLSRAAGNTFLEISRSKVAELPITLPPLVEQRRIVDVIESVDTYINALETRARTARTARSALLHELLSAGGEGWTETTLGKVTEVNPRDPALTADAPFVPMDSVKVGTRWVTYTEPRGTRSGARGRAGDTFFARITPCLENGKVAQIQPGIDRCGGSTEFLVLRSSDHTDPAFIYMWSTWERTRNSAASLMTGTTGRQRLAASDLAALPFSLPPLVEQRRIVEVIESMDGAIAMADAAVADARDLRSALLSDLLSGDHEIPESYDKFLGAT